MNGTFDYKGTAGVILSRLQSQEPLVYARRSYGKTTSLMHHIAGRWIADPSKQMIVITFNQANNYYAHKLFNELFPSVLTPKFLSIRQIEQLRGLDKSNMEIYLDEFEYFDDLERSELMPYITYIKGGVSSPKHEDIYSTRVESMF